MRESTTVYGPDHRETLAARIGLARQVGAAGNPGQALTMAQELSLIHISEPTRPY